MSAPSPLPGYWRLESSGVLAPVVEAYLRNEPLDYGQVMVMKMYLRRWVNNPGWRGGLQLQALRDSAEQIRTRRDIAAWLERADALGIDPL